MVKPKKKSLISIFKWNNLILEHLGYIFNVAQLVSARA